MFEGAPIAYWIGFHAIVLVLIASDLLLVNRRPQSGRSKSSLFFVLFLVALAVAFGVLLGYLRGHQAGMEFASGYLIELSLSVDNLFIFLVLFRAFGLALEERRKALFYGVIGAIVMRAVFIFLGIALIQRFQWIQIGFGVLLIFAAFRLVREKKEDEGQQKWIQRFVQFGRGRPGRTLFAAIIAIEIVDLIFALDSIPAVLAVTQEPFIVYTSNIFAILGLRSLFFLLENLLDRLRYLHYGLAAILAFVGGKMIAARWVHVPISLSLAVILGVIAIATAASLLHPGGSQAPPQEQG